MLTHPEKEFINCAGMTRFYFTHYQYLHGGGLLYINNHTHLPLSVNTIESLPSKMWYFTLEVKPHVEKMFDDAKQYQSCKKMVQMKCSLESWPFFALQWLILVLLFLIITENIQKKNHYCDLSLMSSLYHKYLQLIRLDTDITMNWARNLFGLTFGIGCQNRAPKKEMI